MRNRKRINYKVVSETGDRTEVVKNQEQQEIEEVGEISTLLRSISISEELQHLHMTETILHEDNMEKQRIDSLKVDEFTLAEDIADYIDEIDVGNSSTMEEIDSKISRVEQLRTSCRRLHNELTITLQDRYPEEYEENYEKKLQNNYIKNVKSSICQRRDQKLTSSRNHQN